MNRFNTPVGDIEIRIDGKAAEFSGQSIKKEKTCPDVLGRYALTVDFKPDGEHHTISCHILGIGNDDRNDLETGERLECKCFYKGDYKISLGMEGDSGYICGKRVSEFDYDNDYFDDGVSFEILPETKTEHYIFGVSWIDKPSEKRDIQTWFGADPTYFKFDPPEEVYCPVSGRVIEDIVCIETREAVDGMIVDKYMHDGFADKENCKMRCKMCKWHNF